MNHPSQQPWQPDWPTSPEGTAPTQMSPSIEGAAVREPAAPIRPVRLRAPNPAEGVGGATPTQALAEDGLRPSPAGGALGQAEPASQGIRIVHPIRQVHLVQTPPLTRIGSRTVENDPETRLDPAYPSAQSVDLEPAGAPEDPVIPPEAACPANDPVIPYPNQPLGVDTQGLPDFLQKIGWLRLSASPKGDPRAYKTQGVLNFAALALTSPLFALYFGRQGWAQVLFYVLGLLGLLSQGFGLTALSRQILTRSIPGQPTRFAYLYPQVLAFLTGLLLTLALLAQSGRPTALLIGLGSLLTLLILGLNIGRLALEAMGLGRWLGTGLATLSFYSMALTAWAWLHLGALTLRTILGILAALVALLGGGLTAWKRFLVPQAALPRSGRFAPTLASRLTACLKSAGWLSLLALLGGPIWGLPLLITLILLGLAWLALAAGMWRIWSTQLEETVRRQTLFSGTLFLIAAKPALINLQLAIGQGRSQQIMIYVILGLLYIVLLHVAIVYLLTFLEALNQVRYDRLESTS